jgi:hypothetical protein
MNYPQGQPQTPPQDAGSALVQNQLILMINGNTTNRSHSMCYERDIDKACERTCTLLHCAVL